MQSSFTWTISYFSVIEFNVTLVSRIMTVSCYTLINAKNRISLFLIVNGHQSRESKEIPTTLKRNENYVILLIYDLSSQMSHNIRRRIDRRRRPAVHTKTRKHKNAINNTV